MNQIILAAQRLVDRRGRLRRHRLAIIIALAAASWVLVYGIVHMAIWLVGG